MKDQLEVHSRIIDKTLEEYGIRGWVVKGVMTPTTSIYCVGLPPDETPYLPDIPGLPESIAAALDVSECTIEQNRVRVGARVNVPRYELFPGTEPKERPDLDLNWSKVTG